MEKGNWKWKMGNGKGELRKMVADSSCLPLFPFPFSLFPVSSVFIGVHLWLRRIYEVREAK